MVDIQQRGSQEWAMAVLWLDPDDLVPNPDNPNQQDDKTFNALVDSIETDGWRVPVNAVWVEGRGKYEIVAGEHRWRAAKVIGCKVPVIALPPEEFDQDRRDWNLVKDNILTGALNPEKFAALYDRMVKKYDGEVLQALMGFTDHDAFRKVYKDVIAGLSPEMQQALEAAKDEIRTIDDLSIVLNRLFREFGETLPANFMVFSFAGKDVLWVRADKPLWSLVSKLAEETTNAGGDVSAKMLEVFTAYQQAGVQKP
jgi:hypothetical protein